MARNGFGDEHGQITVSLQPVNEDMSEHVGPEVQELHVLVQSGRARSVTNLGCVLRHQPAATESGG